jgi:hypothetical protein
MLRRDTTFIIGAGASFDLGFPLGDTLRETIVELLNVTRGRTSVTFTDLVIQEALAGQAVQDIGVNWPSRMDAYFRAANVIRDGLPFARSIDSFLDGLRDEPEVVLLGKLAIATAISRAEAASPLAFRRAQAANADAIAASELRSLLASWHSELGQILYDGHTRETLSTVFDHATFVVFNYDRCIEEFLTVSLMRRFNINREQSASLVATCAIIHPYGSVGGHRPHEQGYLSYGQLETDKVISVAAGIRTFTEATADTTSEQIKDAVAHAEVLVFMGFGWLPQNMELLRADNRVTNAEQVFATTMKMDPGEITVVADQINEMLRRGPYIPVYQDQRDYEFVTVLGDCKSLMANCWLRLTRQ